MSYESLDASIQDSQPRDYCEIVHGTVAYRVSFANRDLVVGGKIYTAIAGNRGDLVPAGVTKPSEMLLTLPLDHAFTKRYLQQMSPPKVITATMWSQQSDGSTKQIWTGYIVSMSLDNDNTSAIFRVRSRAAESMLRMVPTVTASRTCPLTWASSRCGVDRNGTGATGLPNKVTAVVTLVSGREVSLDLATIPAADPLRADWARYGELKHLLSGESMTIRFQKDVNPGTSTLTKLTLWAPLVGLVAGNTVEIYAGCDRAIATCNGKFANKKRFGGMPLLPTQNPFAPATWGVIK